MLKKIFFLFGIKQKNISIGRVFFGYCLATTRIGSSFPDNLIPKILYPENLVKDNLEIMRSSGVTMQIETPCRLEDTIVKLGYKAVAFSAKPYAVKMCAVLRFNSRGRCREASSYAHK
jgi:hypothetical protein